jgi:hypothetical protein
VSAFHFGDRCGKCRLLFGSQRNAAAHAKAIEAPVPEPAVCGTPRSDDLCSIVPCVLRP